MSDSEITRRSALARQQPPPPTPLHVCLPCGKPVPASAHANLSLPADIRLRAGCGCQLEAHLLYPWDYSPVSSLRLTCAVKSAHPNQRCRIPDYACGPLRGHPSRITRAWCNDQDPECGRTHVLRSWPEEWACVHHMAGNSIGSILQFAPYHLRCAVLIRRVSSMEQTRE